MGPFYTKSGSPARRIVLCGRLGMEIDEAVIDKAIEAMMPELEAARAHLEEVQTRWNLLHQARAKAAQARLPREDELTYALAVTCRCGAPMAYFPKADPRDWTCARMLLGRTDPETEVLLERGLARALDPSELPAGTVVHDCMPFVFWSVRSDPGRKAL